MMGGVRTVGLTTPKAFVRVALEQRLGFGNGVYHESV